MTLKHYKDLYSSLLLSLIPFLTFLSVENLQQMTDNEIYYFFVINLLWTVIVIILAKILKTIFFFFKLQTKNIYRFSILNYVLLFHFLELKSFFFFINTEYQTELVILLYLCLSFLTLYSLIKFEKFNIFFSKFSIIYFFFILIFLAFNQLFNVKFSSLETFVKESSSNTISFDKKEVSQEKLNQNVYYLIFDGMNTLEYAADHNIIDDKNKYLDKYKSNNLTYIENSLSNYNTTSLSLASIFNLSSENTVLSSDKKYKSNKKFYPNFLSKRSNNLGEILKNNNYKLYWFNDRYYKCQTVLEYNIHCYKNDTLDYFISLNQTYLHNHFLSILFGKIANNQKNNSVIFDFVNEPQKFIKELRVKEDYDNYFIFGHIILPHPPWIFGDECISKKKIDNSGMINDNVENTQESFLGYKKNYLCSLQIIDHLINSIIEIDPKSLIIIQGDHGFNVNIKKKEGLYYNGLINDYDSMLKYINLVENRAKIFNLIKDDDQCRDKDNANSNSNTAVFVLNCLFNLNLKYEEKMHHISFSPLQQNYGKVIKAF